MQLRPSMFVSIAFVLYLDLHIRLVVENKRMLFELSGANVQYCKMIFDYAMIAHHVKSLFVDEPVLLEDTRMIFDLALHGQSQ